MKNLRAQLNPHFLFNSLNSIRALVGINPDQAKSAITQLSGLLRNSINLGKLRLIPLKDELELVDNYLKLEQIRFEERLNVKMQIEDAAKTVRFRR
ncbi:MAG: histidine kinase [Crocinitomicaceae bacterium]|nr:histidine kinase [Crocinitomicaceae bacterium]